jgi:class 3 adenylate cyclase
MDLEALTLTEIIRLQNRLSAHIAQRYEQRLAIVFSDIIGSTSYFTRFGDEAGHRIQQQHCDLLTESLVGSHGRIVDRIGDGIFLVFPAAERALSCLAHGHSAHSKNQMFIRPDQRWQVRTTVHWGSVLTDGNLVAGDAVNVCAKLGATVRAQEIIVTHEALKELPKQYRAMCRPLDPIQPLGLSHPIEVFQFAWRNTEMPKQIHVQETGQRIAIPDKPIVSCGRPSQHQTSPPNDVVLDLQDPLLTRRISRWHVELRQEDDRLFLCSVSDQPTEVDGIPLKKGERVELKCGSAVRLSNVMTLQFESTAPSENQQDLTLPHESTP